MKSKLAKLLWKLAAVSYTHLDVYKRQPVGSVVCLTRVQYEDQLFAARLGITTGGDVTILRDRFLGRRPVSRNRTLWGPWEVIGLS